MTTIVLKFDNENETARSLVETIKKAGVFKIEECSPYNKEFVKKIQKSRLSKGKKIKLSEIWK